MNAKEEKQFKKSLERGCPFGGGQKGSGPGVKRGQGVRGRGQRGKGSKGVRSQIGNLGNCCLVKLIVALFRLSFNLIELFEMSYASASSPDETGAVYHALNRGNARQPVFHKDEDFAAFERVIGEGLEKYSVQLYSYQWMTNHWHMVLSPQLDGEMSRFLYWVTMTHTARYHAHYHTTGEGHVYQGRYKSFPIEEDHHFLTACRYVRAKCIDSQHGRTSGRLALGEPLELVWRGLGCLELIVACPRLPNWLERVNARDECERRKAIQKESGTWLPFWKRGMGRKDCEAAWLGVNPTLSRPPAQVCLNCQFGS